MKVFVVLAVILAVSAAAPQFGGGSANANANANAPAADEGELVLVGIKKVYGRTGGFGPATITGFEGTNSYVNVNAVANANASSRGGGDANANASASFNAFGK
ncbi:uncharacterized protein LOC123037816 [Drosophila rhopaloa]|uniref:Uncharacterized protein n=1 Tax=Drosophila rhopaloa TaxID=1041015 RepID=A0ABM5JBU3_DRORH|nr:uncharacterized protein LOC123037816 [Drosophila rhopaloa]